MIYHQKKNQIEEEQRLRNFMNSLKLPFYRMMAELSRCFLNYIKMRKPLPELELLNLFERIFRAGNGGMFKESLEYYESGRRITRGLKSYYTEIKEQSHAIRFGW
jgi:hypothetical protein